MSDVPIGQPGDNTDHAVSQTVTGITANTTYHFRIVASNPVATSYGSDQTFTTPPAPTSPLNTTVPTITGTPPPGSFLTCSSGNWTGASSFGYQWLRDCAVISEAASQTVLLRMSDLGHTITCRVTASNSTGLTSATSAPVRVVDLAPSRLSGLKLSPKRFKAESSGPSVLMSGKQGTSVTFTLSEHSSVTFSIERTEIGRKLKDGCQPQTRTNRNAGSCTIYVALKGSFKWTGRLGTNTFRFTGRINGRRLTAGTYRAHRQRA